MNAPRALTFTSCVLSGLTPGVESVNVTQEGARGHSKTRYRKYKCSPMYLVYLVCVLCIYYLLLITSFMVNFPGIARGTDWPPGQPVQSAH